MKLATWLEAVGRVGDDLIEEFVKTDLARRARPKKTFRKWLPAVAACLCVAVIVGLVYDKPNEYWVPSGEAWTPVLEEDVSEIVLRADEVAEQFAGTVGTKNYTTYSMENVQSLQLLPLLHSEYLPIYNAKTLGTDRHAFEEFLAQYLPLAKELFGVADSLDCSIESDEALGGSYSAAVEDAEGNLLIGFTASRNQLSFSNRSDVTGGISLAGETVSVLRSDTDVQIKEKLAPLLARFNKAFSVTEIDRTESSIVIEFRTEDQSPFPQAEEDGNYSQEMYGHRLKLVLKPETTGSERFLLTFLKFEQAIWGWDEYYEVVGKARMLTLEQAEKHLKKGYVFGWGCISSRQEEVDFSKYDAVELVYLRDWNASKQRWVCYPFYAFYKDIGADENGRETVARVLVLAVEAEGLEEYFDLQEENHR